MAQNERRRQQALQRKAAKRKQKQQALSRATGTQFAPAGPRRLPAAAGQWPLHECLISRNWQMTEEIVQIVVARRAPSGAIGAGVFLVDLGCLGVKNAFGRLLDSRAEYEAMRDGMAAQQPLVKADLNLVAKVIREAINYAGRLGFKPHPDYNQARPVLEGADADAVEVEVPLGKDGKPFFVAGPYDNVPAIMNKLTRAVGAGNFHYVVPIGGDDLVLGDEDGDDAFKAMAGRRPRSTATKGRFGLGGLFRKPFGR